MSDLSLAERVERFKTNEGKVDTLVNGAAGNSVRLGDTTRPTLNGLMEEISGEAFRAQAVQDATACAKYWARVANAIATTDAVIATGSDEARLLPDWFADVLALKKQAAPRFTVFGGQLARLRQDLLTPNKPVSIVFVGDSITWGAKATGCPSIVSNSGSHTLRDMRDGSSSASFVNNFKRWVAEYLSAAIMRHANEDTHGTDGTNNTADDTTDDTYTYGVTSAYANYSDLYPENTRAEYPSSSSQVSSIGASVAQYTLMQELSPFRPFFTLAGSGGGSYEAVVNNEQYQPGYRLNRALQMTGNAAGSSVSVSFTFTGSSFILYYVQNTGSLPYQIYVNGVLHSENDTSTFTTSGTYSVAASREHNLGSVENATVEIRMVGQGSLILHSIILPKIVTVTNNGISGISAYGYNTSCAPDPAATPAQNAAAFKNSAMPGDYVFIQLGTNDRTEQPKGNPAADSALFRENFSTLLEKFQQYGCTPIIMCAPPARLLTKHHMDMLAVRHCLIEAAQTHGIDFIDNYGIFDGLEMAFYLSSDVLHPNDTGHRMIANNIIAALSAAGVFDHSQYVTLATVQTITGKKTLAANVALDTSSGHRIINGTGEAYGVKYWAGSNVAKGAGLELYGKSYAGDVAGSPDTSLNGAFILRAAAASGTGTKELVGKWGGSLSWNGDAIQTTSDQRLKTQLSAISDAAFEAWGDVRWGAFQYLAAVEEKGEDNARLHCGVIAQQILEAFRLHGLDATAYGLVCHETHPARDWMEDIDGQLVPQHEDAVDIWMIRYTEALAMEAAYQRWRVERLERRIENLESAMDATLRNVVALGLVLSGDDEPVESVPGSAEGTD